MHSGIMSFSESTIVNANRAAHIKPYLEVTSELNAIWLHFDLEGHASILLYCKRGKEEGFQFLEEVNQSPYIDVRPNETKYAEKRTYMAVFAAHGNAIGEADYLEVKTKGKFKFW
jgi:hypothetical protein